MSRENARELRQIADGTTKHVLALKSLKRPTDTWDDILIHVLISKLDPITAREWQSSLTGSEIPTLKQLLDFVLRRYQMLEASARPAAPITQAALPRAATRPAVNIKRGAATYVATVKAPCGFCNGQHIKYACGQLTKLSPQQRLAEIQRRRLALIAFVRRIIMIDHVSDASVSSPLAEPQAPAPTSNGDQSSVAAHAALPAAGNCVILSTAIVDIDDDAGINNTVSSVNHEVQLRLRSRFNTFTATIDCLVADQVTENLPAMTLQLKQIEIPHHIKLADPRFYVSSGIDLLIGADIFWQLLCVGQIKPSEKHPTLQKTQLGWVVGDRHCSSPEITRGRWAQSFHAAITNHSLQQARLIREQVISVLKVGSFTLSKWLSISSKLLDLNQDTNTQTVDFNKDLESRILGIRWNPTSDCFHFFIKEERQVNSVTKRTILSDIARIFDPLGFVGLSVNISKLIIQELWQLNLRAKPVISEAMMGVLPSKRVTPSRPFTHCGVDAGPVLIRDGKRRNCRNVKAYIAIFVCLATRAVHIEVQFWKCWSVEYLSQLQERHKWRRSKGEQLRTGQLVLIKQQGLAPLQWLLGRIEEVHLGSDGIARSAKVKTTKTSVVRPLSTLAILPIEMIIAYLIF
ncbi:hypothetical protein KM043_014474 [Ampulex compressa]|nr:hypothetical protein KM043_014474 [Ampulex compressa]